MYQCHIHLWKDLLVASDESCLIRPCSGQRQTWRTSCVNISAITTRAEHIQGGMAVFVDINDLETSGSKVVDINKYRWEKHCRGLFEIPAAA